MNEKAKNLTDNITSYLSSGGLFNPELMNHNDVKDLLIKCRDELNEKAKDLTDNITSYLSSGGLFNPELMDHNAVRDLLIKCRDELSEQNNFDLSDEASKSSVKENTVRKKM